MTMQARARVPARSGGSPNVSEAAALESAAQVAATPAGGAGWIAPAVVKPVAARVEARLTASGCALLVFELAGLWGLNQLGYLLVARLHVPLPGNVAGMLLLFGLLCAGIVPVRMFERSSTLLSSHLPFFFVPIAVGLMNLGGAVISEGWLLILVLVASAAVGLCTTGWIAQLLSRLRERP
jgi:holin-like protein